MFSVHCPRHNSEVLLTESRIRSIHTSDDGVVVRWSCWCGQPGATHTGRRRSSAGALID